jgi:cytochrome c556
MQRLSRVVLLVVPLAIAVVATNSDGAADKTPTVKEIMEKANKGSDSLLYGLDSDLKEDEVPWADIQKATKEMVKLVDALGKNDPPRGEKESWKKLTKAYSDQVKTLDTAAKKENLKAAKAAMAKLKNSCTNCHKVHRPN